MCVCVRALVLCVRALVLCARMRAPAWRGVPVRHHRTAARSASAALAVPVPLAAGPRLDAGPSERTLRRDGNARSESETGIIKSLLRVAAHLLSRRRPRQARAARQMGLVITRLGFSC